MLAWETSTAAVTMRRRFDEDADEFEDDGFSFDDTEAFLNGHEVVRCHFADSFLTTIRPCDF